MVFIYFVLSLFLYLIHVKELGPQVCFQSSLDRGPF